MISFSDPCGGRTPRGHVWGYLGILETYGVCTPLVEVLIYPCQQLYQQTQCICIAVDQHQICDR